jgi:thioredoxin reductase/NAD-dependent dihydropyrimidine dehydrogenase PreA subunit
VSVEERGAARAQRRRFGPRRFHEFTRFRALALGGVFGGVVILALLAWQHGPGALLAPGPLAPPHREVACAGCHVSSGALGRENLAARCVTCHVQEVSLRPAHHASSAQNELDCTSCHAIHRGDRGIAFMSDGRASWFENGSQLLPDPSARAAPAFVPLIAASGCAHCHDTSSPSDPAAHCFTPKSKDAFALQLCFDEHRRPAHASTRHAAERDALIETTRALALSRPERPLLAWLAFGPSRTFTQVLPGLVLAAAFVLLLRRRKYQPEKPRRVASLVPAGERRLPLIDPARCLGCHACVEACPYDVLEIQRYVAIVARPDDCCGAGPCLERCPNGSLTLSLTGEPRAAPQLHGTLESKGRSNLFLAGDVTGGSLIRNALRQGTSVAHVVAERVAAARAAGGVASDAVDLLIVGAGPAGLAAALTAQALGISFELIEEASVAESIQRFSRHKLVLDGEAGCDEVLPLWIGDGPKEQLLKSWLRTVRTSRLPIRERVRLTGLEDRKLGGFSAYAEGESGQILLQARHVLLAIGARGTPRPLGVPIPEAVLGRVHYALSDARAFAGRRVTVVGLGDVAMESAIALAEQQDCEVTLVHRGSGFRRGKQRNIEAISRLSARGRVKLLLEAHISRVTETDVHVALRSGSCRLPYDAIFVHIGTLPAGSLLETLGVCSRGAGSVAKSDGTRSS